MFYFEQPYVFLLTVVMFKSHGQAKRSGVDFFFQAQGQRTTVQLIGLLLMSPDCVVKITVMVLATITSLNDVGSILIVLPLSYHIPFHSVISVHLHRIMPLSLALSDSP